MSNKTLTRSFAGGVITPEMFGRLDINKYQTGLSLGENFEVYPHGPIANRTGGEWVIEVKDSSKDTILLPFVYSTEQSMVLEFGDLYVRFHTEGGTLLEADQAVTGVSQANPGVLTYTGSDPANGQWYFVSDLVGMGDLNNRYVRVANVDTGAKTFELNDTGGANIDTTAYDAYVSGGTIARVYEIVSPYLVADLYDLHYTQSADVLTIVENGYQQRELRRQGATNWTFADLSFTPAQVAPTNVSMVPAPSGGSIKHRYRVTAVTQDALEESYVAIGFSAAAAIPITAITLASPGQFTIAAHGRVADDSIYIDGAATNGMTQLPDGEYLVNSVVDANNITIKSLDGTVIDTTLYSAYDGTGAQERVTFIVNDLTTAGRLNTITWTAAPGAVRYNVYKYNNGVYGYIGSTSENKFADNNIAADTTRTPPIPDDPFVGANNYPGAVGYWQGRRWFGGTLAKPQNAWATRSGTEKNLSYSIPTRDDDRLAFRIASRQANAIRHFVPLDDMIMLTSGGAWAILSINSDAITPKSIDPRPKGNYGASNVQPIITDTSVLYAQARGGRVRELKFNGTTAGAYKSQDVSIMAPHYFDKYTIRQMAFATAPYPIGWFVRNDGTMLSFTYVPEQEVGAWASHNTQGLFKSVCVVPEGAEDVVYWIAERVINGRTVKYIERKRTRLFADLADCFFVDAGVTYNGPPATVIGGGWHLEGATVNALADGAVVRGLVVTDGKITLQQAASKVTYGLQITARAKTLPISLETQALGQGSQKNVNKAYMRVHESSQIKAGPSFDKLKLFKQRTTEPYGSPPELVSMEAGIVLAPSWNDSGQICVEQADPLPLTLLSMTLDVALGG